MLNLLRISLEAHHPSEDRHRAYEVTVGRDLLADWVVTVHFGRVGSAGRSLVYAFASREEARRLVRARLLRRSTARRRIGCDYRVVRLEAAAEFELAAWVPAAPGSRPGEPAGG